LLRVSSRAALGLNCKHEETGMGVQSTSFGSRKALLKQWHPSGMRYWFYTAGRSDS
jgi:hypothetical protein